MPDFWYQALTGTGSVEEGWITASSEVQVEERLRVQGAYLIKTEVRARPESDGAGDVDREQLVALIEYLAGGLGAGLPLLRVLDDLPRHVRSRALVAALSQVRTDVVEHGLGLADALARHPATFPKSLIATLKSAEPGPRTATALSQLAAHLEWEHDVASVVRRATIWLAASCAATIALTGIVVAIVFPRMLPLLRAREIALPWPTRLVVGVVALVHASWIPALGLLALVLVGAALLLRTTQGRELLDRLALRVPLLRPLMREASFAGVTAYLRLFYGGSGKLLDSLLDVEQLTRNRVVAAVVRRARELFASGETLANALGHSPLVPSVVIRNLAWGESAGRIDDALERVDAHFKRRVPDLVRRRIRTVSLVVVGVLVVTMITVGLAILLPTLDLVSSIGVRP